MPLRQRKTLLQGLPDTLLQTGHAGENQRCYALFRPKDVVELSVVINQAHNQPEGKQVFTKPLSHTILLCIRSFVITILQFIYLIVILI
jgi:hypothetical protein